MINDDCYTELPWGVVGEVHALTSDGGAIYFMQSEEKHGIRSAMLTRYRMDLSKPNYLEKENLGGAGDEMRWYIL